MPRTTKKKVKEQNEKSVPTVTQLDVAREIAKKVRGFTLEDIQRIINAEQEVTLKYLKRGKKVVKKNYLILTPIDVAPREWTSPLNGKQYSLPARKSVSVKLGKKLKDVVNR